MLSSKGELMIRRNDVDVVRLHLHRLRHLRDRHRRLLLEHTRELTLELRRKMHHDDEGEAGVRLHVAEKLLQRRDSASRGAQADHRRRLVRIAPLLRAIARIVRRLVRGRGIELLGGLFFFGVNRGSRLLLAAVHSQRKRAALAG